MSITTTHFVSVGFTLKVWRNWIRTKGMRLRKALRVHLRLPLNRIYWVFGSPRGGTTWLMEVLQRGFDLHSIHEPTMRHNPDFPKSDIDTKVRIATHLSETGVPEEWLRELVAGRYSNYSIDKSNPVLSLRPRRGVVLKDIGFRMLQIPALTSLHTDVIPVIILRQPIDTLKSVITAQETWQSPSIFQIEYLAEFVDSNTDVLTPEIVSRIKRATTALGQLDARQVWVAKWCIENLVALESQADNPKTKVVLYDKMTQPTPEAKAYLEAIFGKFDHNPKLSKRSQTDLRQSPGSTPEIERQTAKTLAGFGLEPFTLPGQPHLLDLEALIADYRKPASDRLTPRFMR